MKYIIQACYVGGGLAHGVTGCLLLINFFSETRQSVSCKVFGEWTPRDDRATLPNPL